MAVFACLVLAADACNEKCLKVNQKISPHVFSPYLQWKIAHEVPSTLRGTFKR